MSMRSAFLFTLLCGGSSALAFGLPPAESYLHKSDADAARAGHYDRVCIAKDEVMPDSQHLVLSLPTDQCFKMDALVEMKGVWIDAFEGSAFYPGRTTRPLPEPSFGPPGHFNHAAFERYRRKQIWLDVSRVQLPRDYKHRREGNAVLIDFIGRKTSYTGSYGHLGMFGNEIIVDRVISSRRLD
jgi:hypothetical protein